MFNCKQTYRMTRILFTIIFTFVFHLFRLCAQEYSIGDIIEKDGISYKVLSTFLVTDAKESPDTIKSPSKFYQSGELMAINVDEGLSDVVIPTSVGRFIVIGLTDSLFYNHEHNKIWLPNLQFAGNGCFAKLKMKSGALVVHNISQYGYGVFEDLNADLIFDITQEVSLSNAFRKDTMVISSKTKKPIKTYTESKPKGLIKMNTKMLKFDKYKDVYNNCYSATSKNYNNWLDKAFNNDKVFQNNDKADKNRQHNKRSFTTTPRGVNKGFSITASAINHKDYRERLPWGNLTKNYTRKTRYTVYNKRTRKQTYFDDFIPVYDISQKEGWCIKLVDEFGETRYTLNGKKIKE